MTHTQYQKEKKQSHLAPQPNTTLFSQPPHPTLPNLATLTLTPAKPTPPLVIWRRNLTKIHNIYISLRNRKEFSISVVNNLNDEFMSLFINFH